MYQERQQSDYFRTNLQDSDKSHLEGLEPLVFYMVSY